jgi:chromosome partitioning protein
MIIDPRSMSSQDLQRALDFIRKTACFSGKGGVGKSTLSANLAVYLSRYGRHVLLIDVDFQANVSISLTDNVGEPTLTDVLLNRSKFSEAIRQIRPNLWLIPASSKLYEANDLLVAETGGDKKMRRLVNAFLASGGIVQEDGTRVLPDFILYDIGGFTKISQAVLLAADDILVPIIPEFFSYQGLETIWAELTYFMTMLECSVNVAGIVPNQVNESRRITKDYLKGLHQGRFKGLVYPPIHISVKIPESQENGKSIFEFAPDVRAAKEFEQAIRFYLAELDLSGYVPYPPDDEEVQEQEEALNA